MAPAASQFDQRVAAVRRFNRFYTGQIGLLQDRWLQSPFSLTEARVLYEIANRARATASEIGRELKLDAGYLSRILRHFRQKGFVRKTPSEKDGRSAFLTLTARGRAAFAPLDRRSGEQVAAMLNKIPPAKQKRVVSAMADIETLIGKTRAKERSYILRPHKMGDMGWVVARHGALYAAEYGWDSRIEALTADIVSTFLKNFDVKREACWIAEIDGEPVGSVFLVRETDDVARLRLLIVEPQARGLGIGKRLVDECISFARRAGYARITLWTHGVLTAARAIYQRAGFRLVDQRVHDEFGKPEASETWELTL